MAIPDPNTNQPIKISDRTVPLAFNAFGGTTVFDIDTGVAGIPNVSTRLANWTINADATVNFTTNQNLAALVVEDTGLVTVTTATPPNYKILYVNSLNIISGGKLDLTNNAMVIDFATDGDARGFESQLRTWLVQGRGGSGVGNGTWTGMTGITSSTAAAWNAIVNQAEARSVGYVVNADLADLVHPVYTVFLGQSVDSSAIILRYTVTGDLDLDGDVDDEDYTVVGAKYAPGVPQAHWHWGDFDFDGDVDGDDVTLFNAFYNTQLES